VAATRTVDGDYGRYMETQPGDIRVESLGDRAELVEKTGLLRWREWGYADPDPTSWIEVTAKEAGPADHLPMTLVAIDAAGDAVGVVGIGPIDGDVSEAERGGRARGSWAWSFALTAGSWGSVVDCRGPAGRRRVSWPSSDLGGNRPKSRGLLSALRLVCPRAPTPRVDGDLYDHPD
jgi:hypothetical protein